MQLTEDTLSEEARLRALSKLNILDTPPEPEFDDLVRIAAAICGTPMSVVSFIDEHRQWHKAGFGVDVPEVPREVSFCNHALRHPGLLLVEDATRDKRFNQNPLVTGETSLRFYAGVAVASPEGQPVGALCVLDRTPRTLNTNQKAALSVLATQVNARLELRVQRLELEQALAEAEATQARLLASEQRFQTFMDSGPFLGYLKDRDGRFLYYNRRMAEHFDVSREFLLHKTDDELWPADLAASYRSHDTIALQSGELQIVEEEMLNPDGSLSLWRSYKFPFIDAEGACLIGGVSLDVTEDRRREADLRRSREELEAANRLLQQQAVIDGLTGLANRRAFDERLKLDFRAARRAGKPLCLLLIDIDDFKQHNDRFGHQHGDNVLRELGECLRKQLRVDDLAARYGGEEFAILLPEADEDQASGLAHRLLIAIRRHPWPKAPVSISIGLSRLNSATRDTHHLVALADEALYAAKRSGKDRVVAYQHVYDAALADATTFQRLSKTAESL